MKIFSGSSNKPLAEKVAKKLGTPLGKIELSRFPNGEARVWVKDKITNATTAILQSFSYLPDEHIIEFCLICDGLKRAGVKKIIAIVPWLGYSKQDKIFRRGEPLSVKVIAKIIQVASFDQLIVFDLHNPSIIGFFEVPVIQVSAQGLFLDYFRKHEAKNQIVVAPDAGSIKTSTFFAQKLDIPVAYVDKERNLVTGEVAIHGISSPVSGRQVIIIDDLVSTGATLIETSKYLKQQGAKKISVAVTHHLFIKGVQERLDKSPIDKLIVTDTIVAPKNLTAKKLKIITVAGLIAKEIKKLI